MDTTSVALKRCSRCKKDLPLASFSKDKYGPMGLKSNCKGCCSDYAKDLYNKTVHTSDEYRSKHKPKFMLYSARQRAGKFNVPFNLTVEDITIPEYCPILKVKLEYNTDYAPSIDRIIPELGYVRGNIMVVSKKANLMKNDASIEQLVAFSKGILRLYDS